MPQFVNAPTSPGAYWARYSTTNRWHLIVHVTGEAPFQRMQTLRLKDHLPPVRNAWLAPHELVFGPQLIPPPDDQPAQ